MKIKYMLLALMPLCIASCSDEETISPAGNGQEVRVTAGVGSHSRMVLNDQGTYTESLWQNGDCISLFTATQSNLTYSTAIEDSAATAEFTATDESLQYIEGNTVYACYPDVTATEENNLIVNLPTTDSFDYNNGTVRSFCYAVDKIASGSLNFKFKHLSAFLCLTVTPDMLTDATKGISTVTVTTSATEPLSVGEGDTFDFTTQTANTTNGSNTVLVNVDNRVVDAEWTVYVPILPQPAGADITVTLADSDGTTLYTLTKQTPENGFLAGYVYKQGATGTYETSYLVDGPTFNASIKKFVNSSVSGRATSEVDSLVWLSDSLIAKIEFLTEVPSLPENYITVSAEDSPAPINATFNATDSLLTIFTPAKDIEVVDASLTFNQLLSLRTIDFGKFDINEKTTSTHEMFYNCPSLTTLDIDDWNTENVTDMSGMFFHCLSLTTLDVGYWNTENVTNMREMFGYCRALTTLDVSNWNTANVTNLSWMFDSCPSLTTLDVSNWNTEKVTDMSGMFWNCYKLPILDVSNWNTENVTDIGGMFYGCYELTTLDVSNWVTTNVTDMSGVFNGCFALTALDVSNWNTKNVTSMGGMFIQCYKLTTLDVSNWDTSNVTTMYNMFYECSSLTTLDVSNWDTSNITDMGWTFFYCEALKELDVSNWDTSNVTRMYSLFNTCSSLTDLDVSQWNTENVTEMCWMFRNLSLITNLDISNWETGNVTNMRQMFCGSSALTTLDISNWNTENVTNMHQMFLSCSSLTTLKVPDWNTNKVIDMGWMFGYCSSLTDLNVSNWNTENAIEMDSLFYYCPSLTSLDISNWTFDDNKDISVMFADCASTSQACKITATSEAKDFLLARTGTTSMNPDWFIWGDAESGGSSFDDIPKQEWKAVLRSRALTNKPEKSKEVDRQERRAGSRGAAPDGGRLSGDNPRHHRPSSLYDGDYRTTRY